MSVFNGKLELHCTEYQISLLALRLICIAECVTVKSADAQLYLALW
jgi:hypothetical protein